MNANIKIPSSPKGRMNLIYKTVKRYGIDNRKYHDESWQAMRDYDDAISSLGCEFNYWCENGGYTDYVPHDHMPRSKEYKVEIIFPDGGVIDGYAKMMAAGTVEDPFESYDTCLVLWNGTKRNDDGVIRITESDLMRMVGLSIRRMLNEAFSVDDESQRLFDAAVKKYGVTSDFNIGGYLLPNGRMLKFGSRGSRYMDHREIEKIYAALGIDVPNAQHSTDYMLDFIGRGVIRMEPECDGISLMREPTSEQYNVIRRYVRFCEGDFLIDFDNEYGDTVDYAEYDGVKPERVVADIYRYYREGLKPMNCVSESKRKVKEKLKRNRFK